MPDGGTHKFTPDKNHFCTHVSRDGSICGASLNQSCHYHPEPPAATLNGESMKADEIGFVSTGDAARSAPSVLADHQAKKLYMGRASYDFIKSGDFQTDGFAVTVAGHKIAECEDSEVADWICGQWNAYPEPNPEPPSKVALNGGEMKQELPPLPNPITTSFYWNSTIDLPLSGEHAARLEREDQLLASLRRISELESALNHDLRDDFARLQDIGCSRTKENEGEAPTLWRYRNDRAEKAEAELSRLRKGEHRDGFKEGVLAAAKVLHEQWKDKLAAEVLTLLRPTPPKGEETEHGI